MRPDGPHTHGHGGGGGGGLAVAVGVLIALALIVRATAAAVAELFEVLLIVAASVAGLAVAGCVAWLVYRRRASRVMPTPGGHIHYRQAIPPQQPRAQLPPIPVHQHVHFHGLRPEDVAAILAAQQRQGTPPWPERQQEEQ